MFKKRLSYENRQALIVLAALLTLPLLLLMINLFVPQTTTPPEPTSAKNIEKTVIITEVKQNSAPHPAPQKAVAATVRDAIMQGNFSTAYLEVSKLSKTSPEYEELNKQLSEETQKRKAPGIRKEAVTSSSSPIRYFDESTPRDRSSDAIYIYFVDISGTLWPRFCIQAVSKQILGITGFTATADGKTFTITPASIKSEKTGKGVAQWYDVPLDRQTYVTVKALIRARKATLTIIGSGGKTTRDVTENELKGFGRIIEGYAALGGNLNYLRDPTPNTRKKPKT